MTNTHIIQQIQHTKHTNHTNHTNHTHIKRIQHNMSTMECPICPIPVKELVPDNGRISKTGDFVEDTHDIMYKRANIGELFDVCCVAMKTKPLAALDLSSQTGIERIKDNLEDMYIDTELFHKAIFYLNSIKLPNFKWCTKEGNYLRNIYYNPSIVGSKQNALKLLLVLHTDYFDINEMDYHIVIGNLLGYPADRIKGYLLRNINYRIFVEEASDLDLLHKRNNRRSNVMGYR